MIDAKKQVNFPSENRDGALRRQTVLFRNIEIDNQAQTCSCNCLGGQQTDTAGFNLIGDTFGATDPETGFPVPPHQRPVVSYKLGSI